jgi:peptidyl-prolyl cis-trans isomerase D
MLQKIRDNLQGTIAKVTIAVIAVPFAVFGIEAFFTGGEPKVATVGDEVITQRELEQAIELQRRRLVGSAEENVDPAELEDAKLRGPVLDSLIERKLLGQVASRSGFRVGDAMIDRIILDDQSFQESGKFSQERFQGILASNGLTPTYYRNLLREELLINQVLGGFATSDFSTEAEIREVARITQQSVDVRYLTVPLETVGAAPEVPADRVSAYYDANKADFRTPETVGLDYLELRIEDLYQKVPEDEVKAEYQRRLADYKDAEERHAAHIMISSLEDEKAKARLGELRARIEKGEDFATIAREASEDVGSAQDGGDLGYSGGDAFPAEFEQALTALKPGQVSEPLRTESGWHLVKLLDVRAKEAPSLADLRPEIESGLQKKAAKPLFIEKSEQLADLTFNSEGLADAAKSLGLAVKQGPVISRRGAEGLFADSRLINAAFSEDVLKSGQNSDVIELDDGHALVLRLREHNAERQQEMAEVEAPIRALLAESIRRERALQRAKGLLAELGSGTGLETLAKRDSLQWQVALEHRRGAPDLPKELGDAVFTASRTEGGAGAGTVVMPAGDVVVYQVSNFREGELERIPAEQQLQLRSMLAQSRGAAAAAHYRQRLRALVDVQIL